MVMVVRKRANACVENAMPLRRIKIKVAFVIVDIKD